MSYQVLVDDNFHYMDQDERYTLGQFDNLDEAIAACKRIVDEFLIHSYKPGMTAEELYQGYVGFGEDPFIVGPGATREFSAWAYAKTRCVEIARAERTSSSDAGSQQMGSVNDS